MKAIKYRLFFMLSILLVLVITVQAEETPWPVPEEQQAKLSPFIFNDSVVSAGNNIYIKNCKSCHGDMGKHNMVKLDPLPKDLTSLPVLEQSDGELFYKIYNGRGAMPAFKNIFSTNEVWQVIGVIRSYQQGYVQQLPELTQVGSEGSVKLNMKWIQDSSTVLVNVFTMHDSIAEPVPGVEVILNVERYFGLLKLGDSKTSDKNGVVNFVVSETIPGDSAGYLDFVAKVVDSETYGDAKAAGHYLAGAPNYKPSLTENRAIWNVVTKAPWWISIAYPLAVLSVLITLLYIVKLLFKIYKIGSDEELKESSIE